MYLDFKKWTDSRNPLFEKADAPKQKKPYKAPAIDKSEMSLQDIFDCSDVTPDDFAHMFNVLQVIKDVAFDNDDLALVFKVDRMLVTFKRLLAHYKAEHDVAEGSTEDE